MFSAGTYIRRRRALKQAMRTGLLFFPGNDESPMNYPDNGYRFRQDSSFLYYWGLDRPGLAAVLDVDEDQAVLFGDDPTLDDIIWSGPQPALGEQARQVGVVATAPLAELPAFLDAALRKRRPLHYLPQYRAENRLKVEALLGIRAPHVNRYASPKLTRAVIDQRSVKTEDEVAEIERAVDVSFLMHTEAMRRARPGVVEQEVVGFVEGLAVSHGGYPSFPIIFSTHGETLHNHAHHRTMQAGDLVVHDSGTVSPLHYASDITRTIPVAGRFDERQRAVYQVVLEALEAAIAATRPGVLFRNVHLLACRSMTAGLKALGLMKGDVEEAVAAGAHAVFFQCGLGHMMGLDVHDMEGLGEEEVGYDAAVRRSDQFGLCYLRLARTLEPGFVLTIEPGVYFIPALLDRWRAEGRFTSFIDYDAFDAFRDFGGIRIEDDVLVTDGGCRVLGRPIPRTIADVEALCAR